MDNKPGRIRPNPPDTNFRGQLGYRNREGRSGLDPLDVQTEMGRAQGLFIKNLFTLGLRTRNPFALFLMIFGGLGLLIPSSLAILALFDSPIQAGSQGTGFQTLCCFSPLIIVGGFLITNVILSLRPEPKRVRRRKKRAEPEPDEESR